jgi:DNA-binding MarR family transcriptional regulator
MKLAEFAQLSRYGNYGRQIRSQVRYAKIAKLIMEGKNTTKQIADGMGDTTGNINHALGRMKRKGLIKTVHHWELIQ